MQKVINGIVIGAVIAGALGGLHHAGKAIKTAIENKKPTEQVQEVDNEEEAGNIAIEGNSAVIRL